MEYTDKDAPPPQFKVQANVFLEGQREFEAVVLVLAAKIIMQKAGYGGHLPGTSISSHLSQYRIRSAYVHQPPSLCLSSFIQRAQSPNDWLILDWTGWLLFQHHWLRREPQPKITTLIAFQFLMESARISKVLCRGVHAECFAPLATLEKDKLAALPAA